MARLGEYDEARKIVNDARQRYTSAGFDRLTPGLLRCDYQLAMFDEAEAELLEDKDVDRACKLARKALERHIAVSDLRLECLPPLSVDARKSADEVRRSEELLARLEQKLQEE